MQVLKKTRNLGIRANDEQRAELKQAALDRRITVQRLFELAVESYLATTKGVASSTTKAKNVTEFPMTPIGKECHNLLAKIIQHAEPKKIATVRDYLEIIGSSVRVDRDEASDRGVVERSLSEDHRSAESDDPRGKRKRGPR